MSHPRFSSPRGFPVAAVSVFFSFSRPGVVGVATVSVFFLFSDLGRGGRGWLPFTTGSKGLQTCLIWYLYLLVERNF